MFKDHPKGLFVAFFANMGERFGFYTMMAILVLFLQARYDLSAEAASKYYSWFYYAIYALALVRRHPGRQHQQVQAGHLFRHHRHVRRLRRHGHPGHAADHHPGRPVRHRLRQRPLQGQPAGGGRAAVRRPEVFQAARHGLHDLLHGHQRRRFFRPLRRHRHPQLVPQNAGLRPRRQPAGHVPRLPERPHDRQRLDRQPGEPGLQSVQRHGRRRRPTQGVRRQLHQRLLQEGTITRSASPRWR